eukprot:197506-Pyramimonas_sp.AAC.1
MGSESTVHQMVRGRRPLASILSTVQSSTGEEEVVEAPRRVPLQYSTVHYRYSPVQVQSRHSGGAPGARPRWPGGS